MLTRHLVDAGHRVIATDASPAMLDVARDYLGADAPELRRLALPADPLPEADAIVGIGHPINYLPDAAAIEQALRAIAGALRPGGVLALDVGVDDRLAARVPGRSLGLGGQFQIDAHLSIDID